MIINIFVQFLLRVLIKTLIRYAELVHFNKSQCLKNKIFKADDTTDDKDLFLKEGDDVKSLCGAPLCVRLLK